MLKFFCVWTGPAYGPEYVAILRNMISRHVGGKPFRLHCLTDRTPEMAQRLMDPTNIKFMPIAKTGLQGWWAKLLLLDPALRGPGRAVYLDLDTVVVGSLLPLFKGSINGLGICENFTKRASPTQTYACDYGSCVMVFDDGWGSEQAERFRNERAKLIARASRYGDQFVIEELYPNATYLQDLVGERFFVGRRDFHKYNEPPSGASLLIFAGPEKPHSTAYKWTKEYWR